jgi:hypothetical protein
MTRLPLALLTALTAGALAAPAPPALPGSAFCHTYHCQRVGTLPVRASQVLDLYTLPGASLAELRVWRDEQGVPGASYVLHTPADVAEAKLPVVAQFLSAAVGVPVRTEDLGRAWSATPDEVTRAARANLPAYVVHLLRGQVPYTLQVVQDLTETDGTPDWAYTVRLYRSARLPQIWARRPPVPWGQQPLLSLLAARQLPTFELGRWLSLSPAQRQGLAGLIAEDAAFVQRTLPVGGRLPEPANVTATRLATFLKRQDGQLRQLLGRQYPGLLGWVRTTWAGQP